MRLKMTNAQMLDSLRVLAQAEEKGVLGFAIAKNRHKIADEVKEYSDKYDELLRKYGTDIGAGRFELLPDALPAFQAELRPYAEMTAEVSVAQVTEEVFCSGNLTSSQMYVLGWMVEED